MLNKKAVALIGIGAIVTVATGSQITFADLSGLLSGKAKEGYIDEINKIKDWAAVLNVSNKINFLISTEGVSAEEASKVVLEALRVTVHGYLRSGVPLEIAISLGEGVTETVEVLINFAKIIGMTPEEVIKGLLKESKFPTSGDQKVVFENCDLYYKLFEDEPDESSYRVNYDSAMNEVREKFKEIAEPKVIGEESIYENYDNLEMKKIREKFKKVTEKKGIAGVSADYLIKFAVSKEKGPVETYYKKSGRGRRIFLNKLGYYSLSGSLKFKVMDFVSRVVKKELSKPLAKFLVECGTEYFPISIPGGSTLARKALASVFKSVLSEVENYVKNNLGNDKHMPIKGFSKEKFLKKAESKVKEKVFLTMSGIEKMDDTVFDKLKETLVLTYNDMLDNLAGDESSRAIAGGGDEEETSKLKSYVCDLVKRTLWGETLGRALKLNKFEDWVVDQLNVTK